jgi:hypothetical protein
MVPDAPAASSSAGSVAGDLRQEAARLRARLGEAPTPSPHARNPFQFEARPSRASRGPVSGPAAMPETVPVPPAPPALTLMGIAATTTAAGPERTAILGGPADAVYMVTVGQRIADRYEVTAIGADAVELKDLTTGGYRRLALR